MTVTRRNTTAPNAIDIISAGVMSTAPTFFHVANVQKLGLS